METSSHASSKSFQSTVRAYVTQVAALLDWLEQVDDFDRPSVLEGWDVRMLLGHLLLIHSGLIDRLGSSTDQTPIPLAEYVRAYRPAASSIAERTSVTAADLSPAEIITALREVPLLTDALGGLSSNTVMMAGRGPITVADWVTTRLVDVVVHCDDLSRSMPERAPVPLLRPALATVTRTLAEALATQAPGRSVEVRIPPFVAVQAVAGPRHTRGTPPNVVETDPLTWLRIATGRLPFATGVATGAIRASGTRADLTDLLPLLS